MGEYYDRMMSAMKKRVVTQEEYDKMVQLCFEIDPYFGKDVVDHFWTVETVLAQETDLNDIREAGVYRIEQKTGMATDRKIPGIRNLGYSIGPVYFDETYHPAKYTPVQWDRTAGAAAQKWLERRSICRRALSCGIS